MKALMSKDISLANRVLDENPCADILSVPSIVDNLEQIEVYSQEIAEIAIDRTEGVYGKNERSWAELPERTPFWACFTIDF